jgi:hypothetical protein
MLGRRIAFIRPSDVGLEITSTVKLGGRKISQHPRSLKKKEETMGWGTGVPVAFAGAVGGVACAFAGYYLSGSNPEVNTIAAVVLFFAGAILASWWTYKKLYG